MTNDEAWNLMSRLAVETDGWDESNIEATVRRMEDWSSAEAGDAAIEHVISTWDRPGRPPWAVLKEAYRTQVHRLAMERPAITAPRNIVSVREGRQIAAKAYDRECRSRDPETDVHILSGFRTNEPNPDTLDWLLSIGKDS